jgi:membrane protease YdiL (CAAX protease family)
MPETLPTLNPFAVVVMMLVLLAIIGAWIGSILRLAFGLPVLPPNTPRLVPWGSISVLGAVLVWIALQVAVPTVYLRAFRHQPPNAAGPRPELSPGEMMTLSAVQNALVLVVVPLAMALTCGARPRDFGLVREGLGKNIVRGIVAYPLLAPFVFGAMIAAVVIWGKTNHPLENAILDDRSAGMVAILVLAGVVLAPASEELIFRGILLGWLTRLAIGRREPVPAELYFHDANERFGPGDEPLPEGPERQVDDPAPVATLPDWPEYDRDNPYASPFSPIVAPSPIVSGDAIGRAVPLFLANVVVSLIFAALHGAVWPTPIPIFFLSLGLGLLYQRTGSIIPATALHMTFNGVSTLLMFLTLGGPGAKAIPPGPAAPKVEAKVAAMIPVVSILKQTH